MTKPGVDQRNTERRALDEQIATVSPLAPLNLPKDEPASSVEAHLHQRRRPFALTGVVENGFIRPLDPAVKLTERSRVIIVATERT
jgi:hypothetical protein